ncbi:MAG TPA: UbiA family prenyltransferase [Candidatus Limnocylindrales bacterium]|jgi:4-hydroxybenzoate polyprenyltransferase|nr:UbiA family prenyltransferase [Candidatus Limnocylindrales bacterium]
MPRYLQAIALVHPFPSALNALLVLGLALLAGGEGAAGAALGLALVMLGIQFSIGAMNDYFDVDLDIVAKPEKPIPSGVVSRQVALGVGIIAGALGIFGAGWFGSRVLLLALAMLAAGLAYDALLKRGPLGWACFAIAFPLLPVFAWYGASGQMPPRPELLLPLAALAGPALQLANGLVDLERDRRLGVRGLPAVLGRVGSLAVLAVVQAAIHAVAWFTLLTGPEASNLALFAVGISGATTLAGVVLSASPDPVWREWGWRGQAVGLALLALGWLAAITA